jgi:hypothetical protein
MIRALSDYQPGVLSAEFMFEVMRAYAVAYRAIHQPILDSL